MKWPNGDPIPPKLAALVEEWRNLPANDFDLVVAITGGERMGKSSLAFNLSSLLDSSFSLPQVSFQNPAFIESGRNLRAGQARVLDEGPFSREAMTTDNKELAEHIFRCGQLYLFNFIVKPNLNWLDAVIAKHRAAYWILVERRGFAKIHKFRRADYPGAKPGWRNVFAFTYPKFEAPWLPEYQGMKREDLYPTRRQQEEKTTRLSWAPHAGFLDQVLAQLKR